MSDHEGYFVVSDAQVARDLAASNRRHRAEIDRLAAENDDLRRRLEEADEARRTLAGILHWRLDGETVTDLAHAVEGHVGVLKAASPHPPAAGEGRALAERIAAALRWHKYLDESTEDSRWIGERYGELKRTLPFDEAGRLAAVEFVERALREHAAPAAGEPGNPSRRCEACRSYHPDTTPCAAATGGGEAARPA
jgi:hypothetical protein